MNETEFLAKAAPASNHYKLNYDLTKERSPKANLNRDRSPKRPMIPYKKDNSPSPVSYKDADVNWRKQSHVNNANSKYTIPKVAKKSYLDEQQKTKKKIPEPGHYQDSMERFLKLSRGTSIPRYKQGR